MSEAPGKPIAARASWLGGLLRTIARALLFAFAFGFLIGTLIRCSAERSQPPRLQYLGERIAAEGSARPA